MIGNDNSEATNEIFSFRGEKPPLRTIITPIAVPEKNENPINNNPVQPAPSNSMGSTTTHVPSPVVEFTNNADNQNNNDENNAEDEEENEEDLEVVSVLMTKILKTHFNFQIFFLFILSFILWDLPLYIIFSISWLNDLLNLIFYLQKLLRMKTKKKMYTRPALNVLESISLALYKILVIFLLKLQINGLVYPLVLIFGHFIAQILFVVYNKVVKDKSILTEGIELAYRLFLCTQATMITLKLDNTLDWEWKDIFWCYWVFFSIMIGVSLGFGIILLGKVYQKCIEKVENYEIKGLFWLFYLSLGITMNSALTITGFVNFYDEKEHKKNNNYLDNILISFIFISIYTVFLLFYTLVTRADLICFLEKIGTDEDSDDEYEDEEEEDETQTKKKKKKIKVENNPLQFYFPSFLSKTSSTYFKTVNLSFLKSNKPAKKQIPKKTKARNLKSNSFILSPHKKILTSPSARPSLKNPNSIGNYLGSFFKKKGPDGQYLNEENKNESARAMVEGVQSNKHIPFSLKDHFNEDLPHFGTSGNSTPPMSKSQPDLFMNKSFHFTTNTKNQTNQTQTGDYEKEAHEPCERDRSVLDQSVNSCLICFDKKPNAVFMDCGHGGVCYECATDIFKKTGECYLCRLAIKQVLELDLNEKNGDIIKVKASARLVTCEDESRFEDNDFQSYV